MDSVPSRDPDERLPAPDDGEETVIARAFEVRKDKYRRVVLHLHKVHGEWYYDYYFDADGILKEELRDIIMSTLFDWDADKQKFVLTDNPVRPE